MTTTPPSILERIMEDLIYGNILWAKTNGRYSLNGGPWSVTSSQANCKLQRLPHPWSVHGIAAVIPATAYGQQGALFQNRPSKQLQVRTVGPPWLIPALHDFPEILSVQGSPELSSQECKVTPPRGQG